MSPCVCTGSPSAGCVRIDETYWQGLSEASKRSFLVQGGMMGPEEIRAFQAYDSWQQAVALRKRDDLGKQLGRQVPDLESFRTVVLHVFKACEGRPVPTVI